jgi:glycosyltransferase involved in cell wall biosynthesis/tRNA A-37 threonylcarbamoyl transferase component Bud32
LVTIVLLATAWGSRHGGINVVNMELARALVQALGSNGRVFCVVPHADEVDVRGARDCGIHIVSLRLPPEELPDLFDVGWVGTAARELGAAGATAIDWCIGHDAISGAAANQMRSEGHVQGSAVLSHMSYQDYQGIKHKSVGSPEHKMQEQRRILRAADVVIAVGPLLCKRASDVVDRTVPYFIPGLPEIKSRPNRHQFVGISFGRFERANDRIKQIQLVAEGFARALVRGDAPGSPAILRDNPTLKLIGVATDEEESAALKKAVTERAGRLVNLRPMPYNEKRDEIYADLAGSSVALMLSWHEGFGLTGWEAIAANVPLIVSEQTGLHMFLREEGVEGFVYGLRVDGSFGNDERPNFTDGDRERVADAILDVARDPEAARRKAKNLKGHFVRQGFTWLRAARAVVEALGIECPPMVTPESSERDAAQHFVTTCRLPDSATAATTKPGRVAKITLGEKKEPRNAGKLEKRKSSTATGGKKASKRKLRAEGASEPDSVVTDTERARRDFEEGVPGGSDIGLTFRSLTFSGWLSRHDERDVASFRCGNHQFVIKRTPSCQCDPDALREVSGTSISGEAWRIRATIATPVCIRVHDGRLYELHLFQKGITLDRLVTRNRYQISGDYLGAAHNALVIALSRLHERNMIHRDVRPHNILVQEDGSLVLLDCTFLCQRQSSQQPVDSGVYSAPETRVGRAAPNSDWYSLAATLAFVATGYAPNVDSLDALAEELSKVGVGAFSFPSDCADRGRWFYSGAGSIWASMLQREPQNRFHGLSSVLFYEHSRAGSRMTLTAVLDLESLGYMLISKGGFSIVSRSKLQSVLKEAEVDDEGARAKGLRADIREHLNGRPNWKR